MVKVRLLILDEYIFWFEKVSKDIFLREDRLTHCMEEGWSVVGEILHKAGKKLLLVSHCPVKIRHR